MARFSADTQAARAALSAGLVALRMATVRGFLLLAVHLACAVPLVLAAEQSGWKSDWEKTITGAKKEGAVYLWGDQEITHRDIVSAFAKEFPFIKPITVTGRVGDLTQRILAERRAGKYMSDAYSGGMGGAAFVDFYRTGVLDSIKSILILPEVTDASKWLGGKHHYLDAENQYLFLYEGSPETPSIFYNTKLVQTNEITSYADLLNPKWKGKIIMFERTGSAFPSLNRMYYNPRLGPDFLKRLISDMNPTVSRNRRQATDWLGAGKFPLCIGCSGVERARKAGVPVSELDRKQLKEAGNRIGPSGNSGLALISKAAYPHAAKVFINWFLSRRGQMVWQEVMNGKVGEPSISMRIDIATDNVLPEAQRENGVEYQVTGIQDPGPPTKFIYKLLGR